MKIPSDIPSASETEKLAHATALIPSRWRPTERWREAMRENFSRCPCRRNPEDTWKIRQAVRDWLALPRGDRGTQEEIARTFGVSKQYINRLAHRLPPSVPLGSPAPGPDAVQKIVPRLERPPVGRIYEPSCITTDAVLLWYAKLPGGR